MKNYILFLISVLYITPIYSQTLYTENFNSYPVGNFGTDYTGAVPAHGGWYTKDDNLLPGSNADYQIVAEANRGNILYFGYTNRIFANKHRVYRDDINTYWQQRTTNNNVFKISIDLFTQEANDQAENFFIENELGEQLVRLMYYGHNRYLRVLKKNLGEFPLQYDNGSFIVLPVNTWVTIEVYIDYNNSNLYISIPTMNNYTAMYTMDTLQQGGTDSEGNPLPNDSPHKLEFRGMSGLTFTNGQVDPNKDNPFKLRVDNISISAQNTVPTVNLSTNEYLASHFNLYPNPATNVVTITNSENMLVNQVVVYDTTGKQISAQNFNAQATIQLNVEHLASGTYMLHITTHEGTAVKKLVKK